MKRSSILHRKLAVYASVVHLRNLVEIEFNRKNNTSHCWHSILSSSAKRFLSILSPYWSHTFTTTATAKRSRRWCAKDRIDEHMQNTECVHRSSTTQNPWRKKRNTLLFVVRLVRDTDFDQCCALLAFWLTFCLHSKTKLVRLIGSTVASVSLLLHITDTCHKYVTEEMSRSLRVAGGRVCGHERRGDEDGIFSIYHLVALYRHTILPLCHTKAATVTVYISPLFTILFMQSWMRPTTITRLRANG